MGPRRSVLLLSALLGALVLCCAAPALALEPAGDGWYWQSPQPQGNVLNAVAFGDATNVWAVGDGGTIMHSADAGATWHVQPSPTKVSLGSVQFVSATQGWAAGGDGWYASDPKESTEGVILHTTDGGATWSVQASGKDAGVADLVFVGDQQGWAVGGRGLILHTADGGQTWAVQKSGVTRNIMSVVFTDAQHGYAGCAEGLLLTTADGGTTWKRARSSADYTEIASLAVGSDGKLWAALGGREYSGSFARLAWTANGGRTWKYPDVSRARSIWDVVADGVHIYAVGPTEDSGDGGATQILVSGDGGATWTANLTGSAALGGIATNGTGALCAVGDLTATSTDDGVSWDGHSTRSDFLSSIDLVGPTEGWAIGGYGGSALDVLLGAGSRSNTLLHTVDGAHWEESFSAKDEAFGDVDFADLSHGWAVGWQGLIRHTADGGHTWQAQSSGTTSPLALVSAPTADSAWAYGYGITRKGLTPTLVRTVDAGATWTPVTTPAGVYSFAMTAGSADRAWLAGVRRTKKAITSVVLRTTDGGSTWSRVALPIPSTQLVIPLGIDFVDADHGWVVALSIMDGSSTIAATSDGGATWNVVASQSAFGDDIMASISFVDAQEGWASGTGIYHTTDGGQTWMPQIAGSQDNGYLVDAFDATHALAVGSGILSTVDAAGDTAPPVTLCAAAGGWTRASVVPTLTAADVGTSGLASTEYSVDGGAWTPGLTPPPFLAPSDHSGDGTHTLQYRSTDNAGNVEPTQQLRVRVDTVKPVTRLGRSVVGRDGVLRMHLRIDDKSCASVHDFGFGLRTLRGRPIGGASWEGSRLRTNHWITLRDSMMGELLDTGVYRVRFYAVDRAGNEQARYAAGLLVVKPHKRRLFPGRPPMSATDAAGHGVYSFGAAQGAAPATVVHRRAAAEATAGARLTAELRRILARISTGAR